ncbi:hypothetical protein [uncultured Clostridium sp.]|uniref:hypothetical protein n=1 Tax=uncultured Clostridium sp. TaxID=59620 RepID=UPI002605EF77|nr:hypothetical protein [uncultured Clostridium sp.]
MRLKRWGIGILISVLFVLGLVITFSNISLSGEKYEVINGTSIESSQEVNSVIDVIENESYQKVSGIDDSVNKEAYVVVDTKDVSQIDSAKIATLSKELGVKFTFIDQKNLDKNTIESEGNTVIPDSKELENYMNEKDAKTTKTADGIRVKLLNNSGIIIFINNLNTVEKNDLKVKNEINELKEKGYSFKALI